MAPGLSTLRYSTGHIDRMVLYETVYPAPIPLITKIKRKRKSKSSKKDGDSSSDEEDDKTKTISFEIPMDPTLNESETYILKVSTFEDGSPEEYCEWRQEMDDLLTAKDWQKDINHRLSVFRALLKGKSASIFAAAYSNKQVENAAAKNNKKVTPEVVLMRAINELTKVVFLKFQDAARLQKRHLKSGIDMGDNNPLPFINRIEKINNFFKYFPVKQIETTDDYQDSLPEDEVVDLISSSKKVKWHIQSLQQGQQLRLMDTLDEARAYYSNLYEADIIRAKLASLHKQANKSSGAVDRKRTHVNNGSGGSGGYKGGNHKTTSTSNKKSKGSSAPLCKTCGKNHKGQCFHDPNFSGKKPAWFESKFDGNKKNTKSSHVIMKRTVANKLVQKAAKKQKAKQKKSNTGSHSDSDDGSEASRNKDYFQMQDHPRSTNSESETESEDYDEFYKKIPRKQKAKSSGQRNSLFPFHTPPNKKSKGSHFSAEIVVQTQNRNHEPVAIRGLLDTGTTSTIILKDYVPKGRANTSKGKKQEWTTIGGTFHTRHKALVDFKFPELNTTKMVSTIVHVDDTTPTKKAAYDIIIGMDLMIELGITVNTASKSIDWEGQSIPLKQRGDLSESYFLQSCFHGSQQPEVLKEAEQRQNKILDADYSKVDNAEYVKELDQLTDDEKVSLLRVLEAHPTLFGGGLGEIKCKPVHLEIKKDAKPYHSRAFPVPQAYERGTKKEIDRFCEIGVMERSHDSEWAAPTFIQKKKTGDIRVLTDFRRLNAVLKRKPFPLPKISDLLLKLNGFKYATAIDLSMGYYHIPLDKHSQELCTTILPWGKFRYKRLPMGVSSAPDIFQAIMQEMLGDLEFVRVYIDDILILSDGTYADHMAKLDQVLTRLEQKGFRANVRKCFFARNSLEYLGYWLTQQGVQPQPKKVEAICRISVPQNRRQLRHFLGMVNYYRDMWQRRSHILAPLSALASSTKPWKWGIEEQKAFEEIKGVISEETLLMFPQFDKPFHVYTDASNYQLGAVIMQEGKPLAFYSRKLTDTQKRYTTGEQELLSIVETLKEFKNILLGQKVIVHTDHMNIIYGNLNNDRIIRWRLLLEEYGPEYQHISGVDNVVADALSRLEIRSPEATGDDLGHVAAHCMCLLIRDESVNPEEMCFANKQAFDFERFPMRPALIAKEQRKDKKLQKSFNQSRKEYSTKRIEGHEVITSADKIVIPAPLQGRIIAWYHHYLAHPGQTRMEATIRSLFVWPDMRKQIRQHVGKCRQCQLCKGNPKSYGHLPVKRAEKPEPWHRVDVDLIGPLSLKTPTGTHKLRAITMIDPATGWFEMKEIDTPDSESTSAAMDDVWFSRYPRPAQIGYDGGSEFKSVFAETIQNYGLKKATTTPYNPQSNGIIERVHQVINDALRTFELEERELDEHDPWTPFLQATCFAIRSTYHTTLGATPAQLVFGRDMILPLKFKADWAMIQSRRQEEMARNNSRENAKRIPHEYTVGDTVSKRTGGILPKLRRKREGPYEVIAVHNNGTVSIRRGIITERLNIRRVDPYTD